jgi:hypothetical protein
VGRSQLRRATLSLPTHREVVAAAFRISALGAPHSKEPSGSRTFPAARLHSTPPRFRLLTFEELHKPEAVTNPHSLCDAAPQGPGLRLRPPLILSGTPSLPRASPT